MKAIAALNVYQKVAIIRRSTDSLTYEDADGNLKTVSDLGHAVSTAAPSISTNKSKHDIPVPQIKMVEEYDKDVPDNYKIKKSFVRYHRPSRAEWTQAMDYVADLEDETWLLNHSKFGGVIHTPGEDGEEVKGEEGLAEVTALIDADKSADISEQGPMMKGDNAATASAPADGAETKVKRSRLPLGIFEKMMDSLEKATAFDAIVSSGQAEHLIHEKIPQIYQLFPVKGRAGVVTTKHVINDVYNYWVQKRSKLKRPLLRRFWPVTSTDDTNPHLVFRPREKEKYKLRKTRRNDMLSFNKMKQLKNDFESLRLVLDLVRKREELHRAHVQLQCELFQQRLFDITDTSGKPRLSEPLKKRDIDEALDVPAYFDMNAGPGSKRGRRGRKATSNSISPVPSSGRVDLDTAEGSTADLGTAQQQVSDAPRIVAGQNFGEPAPGFLHPLSTRESYATSWENVVPHVTSYVDAHPIPTYRFRHRPRVGRGGRLCIDRLPCPSHPDTMPMTFFTAGKGLAREIPGQTQQKARLLDLLPAPLDHQALSRRIEEMSVLALQEEIEYATAAPQAPGPAAEGDENDGEQVLVKLDDWLETDGQPWGEERFAIGPI